MGDTQNIEQRPRISGERLVSVDIFRGMTMAGMILVINPGSWKYIFPILRHASWNGCTFADLIFPLVTTLCGVLTAQLITMKKTGQFKALLLLILGILAIGLGKIWAIWMPINKHLWTGSYVFLTTGFALIVFALLYFFIDVKGYKKGYWPFLVLGTNSIVVYVFSIIVARMIGMLTFTAADGTTYHVRSWLYEKTLAPWFGNLAGSLAWALLYIFFWYGIMLIFYKRKIFIKI